jgi:serine/threonine-protein kinase RsbW
MKKMVIDVLDYYDGAFSEMDDETRSDLKVVLNELLINAIKHGVKEGAECFIKVVAGFIADDVALLVIEDDGEGYDTASIKIRNRIDPAGGRIDEINETGRGIQIVKSICEDFMVNEKGNKVVINKKLRRPAST